eukprot:6945142-Alexandrium_andersonii.AAC.1
MCIRDRPGDDVTLSVAVPSGGVRGVTINGKRYTLGWRSWILWHLHNSTAGGHVGGAALEARVLDVAWWPGLARDVESWVRRCPVCRAIKGRPLGSASWRSERYSAPFRVLQIDLITDLHPESDGCRHVLSAIDGFTEWLWLVPLVDKKPSTVAEALYLSVYLDLAGFPVILRSDNGPEFTAELTRELNRMVGTVQVFGSAYHPRSQALVEGSHRPTEEVLQAFVAAYPDDWATKLPIARW